MPNYTTNLNLAKPLQDEQYDIDVFNANADKIDNFAGQIPARALTADTLTTARKINGVSFKGNADIILPIVDSDNNTIINNDGIISINTDFIFDKNFIKNSKGMKSGDINNNVDLFNDVSSYAHSTFDLSKFTVVGNPTITENGVASGFSASDYITVSGFTFSNTNKIEISVQCIRQGSGAQIVCGNSSNTRLEITDTKVAFRWNNIVIFDMSTGNNTNGDKLNIKIILNDSGSNYLEVIKNDTSYSSNNTTTLGELSINNLVIGKHPSVASYYFQGQIDLKQFSITVDGELAFSGNQTGVDAYTINGETIEIPYTLSKTGSKIVYAQYRDRVEDVYEQYGSALYYTIDETNKNTTLPMGEVYGFIEQSKPTITYW